jgi:hypothetical protein
MGNGLGKRSEPTADRFSILRRIFGKSWLRWVFGAGTIALVGLLVAIGQWVYPDPLRRNESPQGASSAVTSSTSTEQRPYVNSEVVKEIANGSTELAAVFFKPIDQVPPPTFFEPDPSRLDEFIDFLHSHGAIDPHATSVRVTVQGRDENAVIITGVTIKIVEKRDTSGGVFIIYAGGGELKVRPMRVDLDSPNPTAKPYPSDSGEPWSFPLRVSSTDPEVLLINADTQTEGRYYSWFAELHYIIAGKQGVARIDDNGQPFKTVFPKGAQQYMPSPDGKGYVKNS